MPDQVLERPAPLQRSRRVNVHHVIHHLFCAAAMALCLAVDHVSALALLTSVGLAGVSVAWARQARTDRSARELLLDLWVMAISMVVMLPGTATGASAAAGIGGTTAPVAHSHGAGALAEGAGPVLVLVLAGWGVLRIHSVFAEGRPRLVPVLGALMCGAGLVWMLV